jgi:muramoyltetrapeptide carboxypeptidase LdcA involved in peptidoglycan recycling
MNDTDISRGFDAGNYANAYETTDFERALGSLSMNRSAEYVAAFTLGFFSSYERHEMGEHADHYEIALESVGVRARELGIAVD